MVARADLLRWSAESPHEDQSLFDRVSDRSLTVGYADEQVSHLADRMVLADIGRVPIVDRETQRLVGLVARKDLLRIRADRQVRRSQPNGFLWSRDVEGQGRTEVPVPANAGA